MQHDFQSNSPINRIQMYSRRGRAMLMAVAMVFVLNIFQWLITYAYWGRMNQILAHSFPNLMVFGLFCTFIYLIILAAAAMLSYRLMSNGDMFNRPWQGGFGMPMPLAMPGYMPQMQPPEVEMDENQTKYMQFFIDKTERDAETKFPLALSLVSFLVTVELLALIGLFYFFVAFDSMVQYVGP